MLIVYQSHEVTQSLLSTLYLLGSSMLLSSVHPVNSHSFSSFGHMLKLSGTLPDITRHSPVLSMCCLHALRNGWDVAVAFQGACYPWILSASHNAQPVIDSQYVLLE